MIHGLAAKFLLRRATLAVRVTHPAPDGRSYTRHTLAAELGSSIWRSQLEPGWMDAIMENQTLLLFDFFDTSLD
jgi:hypothetical protein